MSGNGDERDGGDRGCDGSLQGMMMVVGDGSLQGRKRGKEGRTSFTFFNFENDCLK